MTTQKKYHSNNNNSIMDVVSMASLSLLCLSFLAHFILRHAYGAFQIHMLREAIMMGMAIFILFVLNTLPNSFSTNDTNRLTDALARLASVMLAISFIMCAVNSISFKINVPLYPGINLGWLLGFAGASILILAFRPLRSKFILAFIGLGVLVFGFLLADGFHQGPITVGTIAWNVASDFEFAELVIILVFYCLIEFTVDNNPIHASNTNRMFFHNARQSLSVAAVFTVAMGVNLKSATIICISFIIIVSFIWVFIPMLSTRQLRLSSLLKENLARFGVAWCAAACAVAVVLRGLGHIGEAAAIGSLGLALVGLSLRWMTLRDLLAILGAASRSILALGVAFLAAALWNLLANSHVDLEAAFQGLGIPGGAIFPLGVLVLLGLMLRLNPLLSLVLTTPILYLGLESFVPAPVWSVPVVAVLTSFMLYLRARTYRTRALGIVGSSLFVALIVSAFGSEPRGGLDPLTQSVSVPSQNFEIGKLTLADGRTLTVDEFEPNTWLRARTSGRAPLRPNHGGSAFDGRRRQIVLFGADTHHRDWNNAVTAFDLESQSWIRHYRSSPRYAMRADAAGNRIAGIIRKLPWPMHTYDGVVYHPKIDALVVAAAPLHGLKAVANGRFDPTWIYDLKSRRWKMGPITGKMTPRFFGGTAIYDERRNSIFYFNSVAAEFAHIPIGKESRYFTFELFQLRDDFSEWRKVADPPPQWTEEIVRNNLIGKGKPAFNAEFDSRSGDILLFMGNTLGTRIQMYEHDEPPRTSGTWRSLRTPGEGCESGVPYAVAQSGDGQFLLRPARARGEENSTCIYDINRNIMVPLNSAMSTSMGMNYNLHHDPTSGLFVLMNGNSLHGGRASVHFIKLDSSRF